MRTKLTQDVSQPSARRGFPWKRVSLCFPEMGPIRETARPACDQPALAGQVGLHGLHRMSHSRVLDAGSPLEESLFLFRPRVRSGEAAELACQATE
jgi:hypothetical protein